MWKKKIRQLLKNSMQPNPADGKALSLRALAKKIGMSPGALSETINGRRNISERVALQIIDGIGLPSDQAESMKIEMRRQIQGDRHLLKDEASEMVGKWYYSTILCLFELSTPIRTEKEISERLGISLEEASAAAEFLTRHKMLERQENGDLELVGTYWTTTDGISSAHVRQAHTNELELARLSLNKISVERRDFTSITFAGNSDQLERVRKEIRSFRDRISHIMSEGDSDQVYKFNIQFFPVDFQQGEKEK